MPFERLNNKITSLNCSNSDIYTLKIGLITVDEGMLAGGTGNQNTAYYLYNDQSYWTMTPCVWSNNRAGMIAIDKYGRLNYTAGLNYTGEVRPVINLRSNITISSGNGTQISPYIVQE